MNTLKTCFTLIVALELVACFSAGGNDDDDDGGGAGGTSTAGTSAGSSSRGGTSATGATGGSTSNNGGAPGGSTATGGAGGTTSTTGGTTGATSELCSLFHDGWAYTVVTYYEPGSDPIVADVDGTAYFEADGTYTQDYYIGGIGNFYAGTYTIEGQRLKTYDEEGLVFDYRFTCGDELRSLVLTIENEDGSPSIVYGLESLSQ